MDTDELGLVDLLAAVQRQLRTALASELDPLDISVDQWRVLRALGRDGALTMGALADAVSMPAPSVTRTIDGLVDRALVFRQAGKTDRRQVEILLSSAGLDLLADATESLDRYQATLIESTGSQALDQTRAALQQLLNALAVRVN